MSVYLDDPKTIRVLELDGGGMRGCYSMWGLHRICTDLNLNGAQLNQVFDVIAGTSIGGLCTTGLCFGKTPAQLFNIMKTKGPDIFDASIIPWIGEHKASWADKLAFVTGFYDSLYDNDELVNVVNSIVGSHTLADIQGSKVIIPTVRYTDQVDDGDKFPKKAKALMLSNIDGYGLTGGWSAKDAAMATSAAPMYLPKWTVGGKTYIDGGLVQNNVSPLAVYVGRILKPRATRVCILSIGTGLGNMGFQRENTSQVHPCPKNAVENLGLLGDCIGMGVSLPQESNDFLIDLMQQASILSFFKYRMNTDFDPAQDSELDSTSDEAIQYFKDQADATYARDEFQIQGLIEHLKLIP